MYNLEALREEYIRWVRENFGHAGDPGTTEMDNAVADFWLQKFSELEREIRELPEKEPAYEDDGYDAGLKWMKEKVLKLFNREK